MKKVLLIFLSAVMVLTMASCGKKEESTPAPKEEQTAEQTEDVLAGKTFGLDAIAYDEGNGWVDGTLDENYPESITFSSDGTYEETVWELNPEDLEDTKFYETKHTGTYKIEGDTLTLSNAVSDNLETDGITKEESEARTTVYTIENGVIVAQMDYHKLSDGSEVTGIRKVYVDKYKL